MRESPPCSPWPEHRIGYLGFDGFLESGDTGFRQGMYGTLPEVLEMVQIVLGASESREIYFNRTLESSIVEEFVVFEKKDVHKKLLFRAWPILYSYDRRLEVQFFDREGTWRDKALPLLRHWTHTNRAKLVLK